MSARTGRGIQLYEEVQITSRVMRSSSLCEARRKRILADVWMN
jgi:hypothetical protein